MKILTTVAALLALAAAPAVVGAANEKTFTSKLSGAAEVPGPGDSDGSGSGVVKIRGKKVCYDIKLKGVAGSSAAHIHKGAKGEAGDVFLALFGSQSDAKHRKGCVAATADQRKAIAKSPKAYYLNVHNADFPGGAVRGQLKKQKK